MIKNRVAIVLFFSLCVGLFWAIDMASARWFVRAGEGEYVERVCQNGIVFNYFHDYYSDVNGGRVDWDKDQFGNDWVTRKVESCNNGTCEELDIISASVGSGGSDLTLAPNHVTDFWVLQWSNEVPLGNTVEVTLDGSDLFNYYFFSGVVEKCTLPSVPPSFYSFCSQTASVGSTHTLNTTDINIIDLEVTLATSSAYSDSFSTNLALPNGTSINILDNYWSSTPIQYISNCNETALYMQADEWFGLLLSDAVDAPYVDIEGGNYDFVKPIVPLANFDGLTSAGEWQLSFKDFRRNPFTVDLDCWCLYVVGTPVNTTYLPIATADTQSSTINNPPTIPANPSPTGSLTIEDNNRMVSLRWSGGDPNGDSVTYDVYLEADDTTPDVLVCGNFTETQCDLNYFFPKIEYYWQVIATDSHGAVTEGPVWKFIDPYSVGVNEISIPGGSFQMGCDSSNPSESCLSDELPLHTVTLDTFRIDTTVVTNFQYFLCELGGGCNPPADTSSFTRFSYYGNPDYYDHPVIHVTWEDANNYCTWAGKRLPTEAEWEKAARGANDTRRFPWGDNPWDCSVGNVWVGSAACVGDTTAVDAYPAGQSPYGAFEMVGNVWEWTNDWYQSDYYVNSPSVNPQGPESGTEKVRRGAAWGTASDNGRLARRIAEDPLFSADYLGFRCVSDPID